MAYIEKMEYANMIEDWEIPTRIFETVLRMFGDMTYDGIDGLKVKASNGLSLVFIYDSETTFVLQYFMNAPTAERIYNLLQGLTAKIKRNTFSKGVLEYDLFDFIPRPILTLPESGIIQWDRITPMNSYTEKEIREIIVRNIFKFLWDIGRALYGLHMNGIRHGDARVDNIGIRNGKFVLFDFDGSSKHEGVSDILTNDYYDLVKSIKFNIGDDHYDVLKVYIPAPEFNFVDLLIRQVQKTVGSLSGETAQGVIAWLDSLNIV